MAIVGIFVKLRSEPGREEGANAEQKLERPGIQGCTQKTGTEGRSTVRPVSAIRWDMGLRELNSELPIEQFLSHPVDWRMVVPDYRITPEKGTKTDRTTVYGLALVTKVNLSRGSVNPFLCAPRVGAGSG